MLKNQLASRKSIMSDFLLIFSLVIMLSLNSSYLLQSNAAVSVETDIQPVLEPNAVIFDWLIMIYLDGDNNLEEYAIDDINEMEAGKITGSNIAVIVMVDRIPGYDTTNGDWTGTKIYNITSDGTITINSVILEDEGEVNMGDGASLESFLDYCFTNFEAENYWLNLWDHGGGTDGICWDDTDSNDFLTIDEMQTAIQNSVTTHSRDIDLITHDACFMNMLEVAYELKDLADYFVASEESIPADGFDYETIISTLEADPTMNTSALAETIVDSYDSFYDSLYGDVTLSTINLTLFDSFVPYLNYFATNLTAVINDGIGRVIDDHFFNSQMFYDDFVLDFMHFIEEILANSTLMTNYPDLNQSAINLISQLNSLIVDNYQGSAYSGNANGVTIFMPYSNAVYDLYIDNYIDVDDIFTDMDWQTDTLWDEFLANFYISGFGKESTDYELLELGVNIGTQSILAGEEHFYEISLSQIGLFEINTQVFSGDADIFLYYDEGESYRLHAYSQLFNPDDGSLETIRADLRPGRFVIMVWGFEESSYDLIMEEVDPIPIIVDETVYGSGGTQEGTLDYHYLQILNYYYNITLSPGSYDFTLTYNGDNVDFDLFILDQDYTVLFQVGTVYDVDQIDLIIDSDITYIICIYGYSGYGSFSFVVTESAPISSTTSTNPLNGFAFLISILGILAVTAIFRIAIKKKST